MHNDDDDDDDDDRHGGTRPGLHRDLVSKKVLINDKRNWAWCYIPAISAIYKMKQEDGKFESRVGCESHSFLKKNKKVHTKKLLKHSGSHLKPQH